MIDKYDEKDIYCKKLGHELNFLYCRTEHDGQPCPAIFDCWHEHLPIGEYMQKNFSPQDVPYLSQPKPDKMHTLMELIQKAQNNHQK